MTALPAGHSPRSHTCNMFLFSVWIKLELRSRSPELPAFWCARIRCSRDLWEGATGPGSPDVQHGAGYGSEIHHY